MTPPSPPPLRLVDSHCHLDRLDLTPFGGQLAGALATAREVGVERFLCVSINLEKFPQLTAIARDFSDVDLSVGVHPGEHVAHEPEVDDLVALARDPTVVAIGETGLDYHYHQGDPGWQQERFRRHIAAARTVGKPLIIHSREARVDTLRILREEGAQDVGGVMHCFTEDWNTAHAAMELGMYISFSGIVTFRNAIELREVATRLPLERLLLETDSPYLAPTPHRGKSNHPAWVLYVAQQIAALRSIDPRELAENTTNNFLRLIHASDK
ncbi:putative metal-dependent hydrolase YcfH [Gammaproteobacteria bacterium]